MIAMILQMTAATAMYVVLTLFVWTVWKKKDRHTLADRLAVGLFYGLCSIASNHISINFEAMLLNVRDIGPLAAGLFFSPVSGIVSGLIGGLERFIIGEYFGIGSFTRVACSLSTCLAGVLSAVLYKWVYEGKRPPLPHAFFLGAVMEVFHMYVVLITHRDQMSMAYTVVRACAVPMILFTGLGLAACSAMILRLSGPAGAVHLRTPRENMPIHVRFQRWLLAVTLILFGVSSLLNSSFHTSMAYQNAVAVLRYERDEIRSRAGEEGGPELLRAWTEKNDPSSDVLYYIVDAEKSAVVSGFGIGEPVPVSSGDLSEIVRYADGEIYSATVEGLPDSGEYLCAPMKLSDRYYLLLATQKTITEESTDRIYETMLLEILVFTTLYVLVAVLADRIVVRNLDRVNASLNRISQGNLEEVVNVRESSEFSELSEDINRTVAALRGYTEAEKKRMGEELKMAATIQEAALPRVFRSPRHDYEIHALMVPARQVGGDFYDFFFIDEHLMALVIADVSGKGVPASLFMMRAKTAIKNDARYGYSPAEVLANANRVLCEGNDAEMFVTVWIGIIDLRNGLMKCANAGHEFPLLMRAGGNYEVMKDRHSIPLAAMDTVRPKEYEVRMNPGDRLLVYTDGVPEAINEQQEGYGTERLLESADRRKQESQQAILEGILEDVRAFAGAEEQFDDITMLGFTYLGPKT